MQRTATCHCGQFTVVATGDPLRVTICHCEECQRRTGSAFNLGAVFESSNIRLEGEYATYHRQGELGLDVEFHFCPTCGSNVHWLYDGIDVVAVGCFADPDFPRPTVSLYGRSRHHWLSAPDVEVGYVSNRDGGVE